MINEKGVNCKLSNKGFTLIELLATISILAILALMAVPNIVGVTERNRDKTYVEDAKKMISLAEYKVNSDSGYKPTTNGSSICIDMTTLGKSNFSTDEGKAPNGGTYDLSRSYVKITNQTSGGVTKLIYTVQLVENKKGKYYGVNAVTKDNLYSNSLTQLVRKNQSLSVFTVCSGGSYNSNNNFQVGGVTNGSSSNYYNIPTTSDTGS